MSESSAARNILTWKHYEAVIGVKIQNTDLAFLWVSLIPSGYLT
jgi:hypothetical protein